MGKASKGYGVSLQEAVLFLRLVALAGFLLGCIASFLGKGEGYVFQRREEGEGREKLDYRLAWDRGRFYSTYRETCGESIVISFIQPYTIQTQFQSTNL